MKIILILCLIILIFVIYFLYNREHFIQIDCDTCPEMIGATGPVGPRGFKGPTGTRGVQGDRGDRGGIGKSAFSLAVENGAPSNVEDWLGTLKGKSTYELAVERRDTNDTWVTTPADWLETLKGDSAFDLALANKPDNENWTDEAGWYDSLKGESAYELANRNNEFANEASWIESLRGDSAFDLADANRTGNENWSNETEWLQSLVGEQGETGSQEDIPSGIIVPYFPQQLYTNNDSESTLRLDDSFKRSLENGPTAIPSGWVLCDGTNNTPDLTGKFILGASASNNLRTRLIGSETVRLTEENMPRHRHTHTNLNVNPALKYENGRWVPNNHNHRPTQTQAEGRGVGDNEHVREDGYNTRDNHTHPFMRGIQSEDLPASQRFRIESPNYRNGAWGAGNQTYWNGRRSGYQNNIIHLARDGGDPYTIETSRSPEHAHTYNIPNSGVQVSCAGQFRQNCTVGRHGHGYVRTDEVGSGTPHNNMPPYYSLVYIMKS